MQTVLTKTKWAIDPMHSHIGFKVKHLMISNVRGTFNEYDGSIYSDEDDFSNAEIEFHVNPASIDTGDEKRDAHLKAADFFDVEKFGEIRFNSTRSGQPDADGNFELYGELTLKGVKKPIKLNVEFSGIAKDPWGNQKAAFNITGKINRKDWGLTWNAALETGGLLLSDEVWINCEVQLTKES